MILALLVAMSLTCLDGCVKERCYQDSDCPGGKVCSAQGKCAFACTSDLDCGEGFECTDHRCAPRTPVQPVTCPADMVVVAGAFCVDRYEASRPDASADSPGTAETMATSRAGVLPWMTQDNATADAACAAAGKRLCTPAEWELACRGPAGTVYGYGDAYNPKTCNGIDTFGPGNFHMEPTGTFPGCTNGWGVFDMNGNVWEHVLGGNERTVRGGAFNCSDSRTFHRCDYVPRTWTPSAQGFRCCRGPESALPDPVPDAAKPDVLPDAVADVASDGAGEGGCIPTDEGKVDPGLADPGPKDSGPKDPGAKDPGLLDAEFEDFGVEAFDAPWDSPKSDAVSDPGGTVLCPIDMVPVPWKAGKVTCMDRYEASRADATSDSPGTSPVATSRPGVLPWHVSTMSLAALAEFSAGCQAAGKRMCTREEWFEACNGPDDTVYFFGDTFDPEKCNCVDTFCDDWCAANGISPCSTGENCGYEYYCFHVMPTGAFPDCTNAYGLFDINGNVWEIVPSDSPRGYEVRGGAYNCGTPSLRLRCDFDAGWDQLFAGFRCCKEPG